MTLRKIQTYYNWIISRSNQSNSIYSTNYKREKGESQSESRILKIDQSEKRIIFSQSETFIFRLDEVELGNIRKFYRIFPSRDFRHFEIFDQLDKRKANQNREFRKKNEPIRSRIIKISNRLD